MADRIRICDEQRRARLVRRHHLAHSADDVVDAVRGVVALHSSDPITPYLAAWARVAGFSREDLDRALYEERALWRLHAMRRTMFVVPTDEAAVFAAGAARAVAARERAKLEGWLGAEMDPDRVAAWLSEVQGRVLAVLADGDERRTQELTDEVGQLATEITLGSGKWTTRSPLSSRLLFLMAMDGDLVRTRPAGTWRSSQYHWSTARRWFGRPLDAMDPAPGRVALTRRYLERYGPVTRTDLRWWTGWTAKQAAQALEGAGVTAVDLESGGEGYVLDGDLDPVVTRAPTVALLVGLDPTPMGWKERDWYLGGHGETLFDRNGNAGPTVWVDGRVVGGWAQRPDGEVVHRLLEDVGADAAQQVEVEAGALTDWLDGVVVTPRFRTPLERELSS